MVLIFVVREKMNKKQTKNCFEFHGRKTADFRPAFRTVNVFIGLASVTSAMR